MELKLKAGDRISIQGFTGSKDKSWLVVQCDKFGNIETLSTRGSFEENFELSSQ